MITEPERTGCLRCPDWPIVAARRRVHARSGQPIVVVEQGARGVVRAVSSEARAEGIVVGLRRREAEARCADLTVIEVDHGGDVREFEAVVRAVEELVPRLVLEQPGSLSFPTRGPSRYFGGDDALGARLVEVVREVGVPDARVGIADGEFAAWLAAHATEDHATEDHARVRVVARGESSAFLAPWPISALTTLSTGDDGEDESAELVDLLSRLGLRTLGAFAALPESAVLGRFGPVGERAHRRARGVDVDHSTATTPPPELVESQELDPPATRVDEAAFVAKVLADRLLARLDERGLCSTRVMVEAETEHGERLTRCWRHEGALTPATLVTRVRWQLEAWLTAERGGSSEDDSEPVTGGLTVLRLAPDDVIPAVGRQLGFWGGDPAAADRADHALARLQGMLGHEAVVTAVAVGGRTPGERVAWIPWGDARDVSGSSSAEEAPWPGRVPGPSPARVLNPPRDADLVDDSGDPVTVSGRGELSADPAALWCDALPGGGGALVAWAGPWVHDLHWWDARRRCARWQVVVAGPHADDTGVACLVALEHGRAVVEAIYD